jgi:CheY-like chemotaxis protein
MKLIFIPIAFLVGVAAFVALLMIVKGGYFATKRRKTKLGLVKVACAGLKLDDEPEVSGELSAAQDADKVGTGAVTVTVSTDAPAPAVAENAGADTNKDAAAGVDTGIAAGGAGQGGLDCSGEDAESQETLAIPVEGIEEGKNDVPGVSPQPSNQPAGDDTRDSGGKPVRQGESHTIEDRPAGTVGPVVRKIVDLPIENPFINGKLSPAGDGSGKKTAVTQRRRLPETVKMKDRKVILAEDVAINRDLIAMYFDGSGVKFEFAVNGREVCEKFERDPSAYSLILMDIQMPEMDGYEVSRKIRSMDVDWAKQIPIIAMTGNDQKEDIDLCFEAGMDDHIPKPIDMEILQEKVFDIIMLSAESF